MVMKSDRRRVAFTAGLQAVSFVPLVIPLLLRVKPIETHAPVRLPAVRVLSAGPPSQSMMRPVLASADLAFTREPSTAARAGLKGQGPS